MKQPVKSVFLKYYCAILALALHTLFLSHMRDMPIRRKTLHVSVIDLISMRRLDYFSLAVLNNYSVCLLCSVSSVPSIFLVIKITRAKFVVSQYKCPSKALVEILPFKLLQYQRQRNPLRESIFSHFFHSFFFCSYS